jgi:lipopolysaccharide transport system ATP-binding protein
MTAPVITVRGLAKAYNIYEKPRDILFEAVFGGVRHDVFWALRNLDLDVFEGERIGIIGANGAGKSTLLRILTGNLTPTAGRVEVNGKISAMLSLTSFLDPEQTGLENIRFNLLVNGAPKAAIPHLTEEIVDFTELGAFIRAPVRTYSSGMNARLAFGISTAITPDILVVDEVLGAGDAYFASKATVRMLELCKQGRALLFVSHAMNAVQMLCDKAIWMDNGEIREIGSVDEIARRYEADFRRQEDEHLRAGNAERASLFVKNVLPEEVGRPDIWRLRLTGAGGRIHDTHYIRRIEASLGGQSFPVTLEFADIDESGVRAALDVASSEWARTHERNGSLARALAPGSSLFRGGHILLRTPIGGDKPGLLGLLVESTSVGATEELALQYADPHSGQWMDLRLVARTEDGAWLCQEFAGELTPSSEDVHTNHLQRVIEVARPDIEIVDVRMIVDGEEALSVVEEQPFEIQVHIHAERVVPIADVWLKLTRADGFYIFWQSSGQVGINLADVIGDRLVTFHFDPNIIGAGDYEVEIDVANGFDIVNNWPHSQVFDRRVNALKFTVAREWKLVMFGPVNYRFPVSEREVASERPEALPLTRSEQVRDS